MTTHTPAIREEFVALLAVGRSSVLIDIVAASDKLVFRNSSSTG